MKLFRTLLIGMILFSIILILCSFSPCVEKGSEFLFSIGTGILASSIVAFFVDYIYRIEKEYYQKKLRKNYFLDLDPSFSWIVFNLHLLITNDNQPVKISSFIENKKKECNQLADEFVKDKEKALGDEFNQSFGVFMTNLEGEYTTILGSIEKNLNITLVMGGISDEESRLITSFCGYVSKIKEAFSNNNYVSFFSSFEYFLQYVDKIINDIAEISFLQNVHYYIDHESKKHAIMEKHKVGKGCEHLFELVDTIQF